MLDEELKCLRRYNASIAQMLNELEAHLAHPLPPEPPFQVLTDAAALHNQVYEMARTAGEVKRAVRDLVLQHTLAADFTLPVQGQ